MLLRFINSSVLFGVGREVLSPSVGECKISHILAPVIINKSCIMISSSRPTVFLLPHPSLRNQETSKITVEGLGFGDPHQKNTLAIH